MLPHHRTLLKDVRLPSLDGVARDLLIIDSTIAEIGVGIEAQPGDRVEFGGGALVLPGLVDAHCHIDKTLVGRPWHSHVSGKSVADRVRVDHELRRSLGMPSVENTTALVQQIIANGTTAVRTHTEIDSEVGLAGVHAVLTVAQNFERHLTIEQVAFPQSGVLHEPGVEELLTEAAALGARVIGGIDPAGADGDPVEHLNRVFRLATATGCGIDIHLHDPGELGAWELQLICERTRVEGLSGRVNISHALALGQVSDVRQGELVDSLASSGVSITTCIAHNDVPPPVRRLVEAGVLLSAGNDSIRNTWSPLGTGDMLERAWLLALRCGLRTDEDLQLALDIVSNNGHRLLDGSRPLGLEVGADADLFLVDAMNIGDAIARRPPRSLVMHRGVIATPGPRPADSTDHNTNQVPTPNSGGVQP